MPFDPVNPFLNLFLVLGVNFLNIVENPNNLVIGLLLFGMECFHFELKGLLPGLQCFLSGLQICDGLALVFNRIPEASNRILERSELFALLLDGRLKGFLSILKQFYIPPETLLSFLKRFYVPLERFLSLVQRFDRSSLLLDRVL